PEWAAMAASLVGGVLFGLGAMNAGDHRVIVADANGMAAHGALTQALENQLAANNAGAIRIGVSFRARDGSFCRTFSTDETAGLACRVADAWRIAIAQESARSSAQYQQAGSETPAAIRDAVAARISGDPLDAAGEARARAEHWQAAHAASR